MRGNEADLMRFCNRVDLGPEDPWPKKVEEQYEKKTAREHNLSLLSC